MKQTEPYRQGYTIVTGATGGIGRAICSFLASEGIPLALACRSRDKALKLMESLPAPEALPHRFVELDLTDTHSIRHAAEELSQLPLCGIINNAGTMRRHFATDAQGRELTMAVNYHNTRLLNELLLQALPDNASVVLTTSITRLLPQRGGDDVDKRHFGQLSTYAKSKRRLTEWAARFCAANPRLRVNCADPGVVDSGMITMHRWYDPLADVFFRPLIRKPRQGAEPALRAYFAKGSGRIYCRLLTHSLPRIR